eukprot:43178-Prymnesium_polylepis.1
MPRPPRPVIAAIATANAEHRKDPMWSLAQTRPSRDPLTGERTSADTNRQHAAQNVQLPQPAGVVSCEQT